MVDRVGPAEQDPQPPSGTVPPGPEEARLGDDRELGVRRLYGFLAALGAGLVVSAVVCLLLYRAFLGDLKRQDPPPPPVPEARERVLPPEPRLQESPPKDMADLRARERGLLSSYGVVDMASGTIRIPIERAIALAAQGMRAASGPEIAAGQGASPGQPGAPGQAHGRPGNETVPEVPGPAAPSAPGREPSRSGDAPDGGAP